MLKQLRDAGAALTRPLQIFAADVTAKLSQPGSDRHTRASEKLFDLALGAGEEKRLKLVQAHLREFDRSLAARFPQLPETASAFAPNKLTR
jgi:hypothetical protein